MRRHSPSGPSASAVRRNGKREPLQGGGGWWWWWWEWEGEGGRGGGTPQEGNLTQRRGEAESAEWKIDTREPTTFQDVSCRHESPAWIAYQPHDPLSTQSISALSASPRLCVSQKRRRARRRTASGNHCKAVMAVVGGSGRWEGRGTPQEGNLTQRRGEAESAEWKIDTREPATFQDVSCRHESPAWIACQLRQGEARRSTQSISALSASPRLCVSQNDNARDDGRQAGTTTRRWWVGVGGGRERNTSEGNLTQRRGEAESAEWKIDTREPATFQDVSCRHESPAWIACQLRQGEIRRSNQSISALSASPRLCVSQNDNARDDRRLAGTTARRRWEWEGRGTPRRGTSRRGAERQRAQRGRLRR